jgi:sulfide:quinone oxidoreductase
VSALPRILIVGAGVGGLEAALCLQALAPDRIELTVLAPEREFVYRALTVGEPFGLGPATRYELAAIARDRGFDLVGGVLAEVRPARREAVTGAGDVLGYDHLMLALGARARVAVPGALTFRGLGDAGRTAIALATAARRGARHVAFAAPDGAAWTLPLYELAFLTDAWARRKRLPLRISIVTAEPAPLAVFGAAASAAVEQRLHDREINILCERAPGAFARGRLELADGARLTVNAVVSLPQAAGPAVPGLPHDDAGFVDVDGFGRIQGFEHVYAVGDMTSRTMKQGGFAAQQADVAARAILHAMGAGPKPEPSRPVLRGLLLTGETPLYLRHDRLRGSEAGDGEPLWWPQEKIASRYLGPYLAAEEDLPSPTGGRGPAR